MNLKENTKIITEEALRLMPSSGTKPFRVVHLHSHQLPACLKTSAHLAESFMLVLLKKNFSEQEFVDYCVKSKEFLAMNEANRMNYLKVIRARIEKPLEMEQWKQMVADIATGLIMHQAKAENIYFKPLEGYENIEFEHTPETIPDSDHQLIFRIYATYFID